MKQVMTLLLSGFLALAGCKGQDNKINSQEKNNSPKIDSKVNREYDEHGNLRRFDSTYTYSYSYGGGNLPDSLPAIMKKHFDRRFFSGDSTLSEGSFFDDSFLKDFFANDNFFRDPFSGNNSRSDTSSKKVPRIINPDEYMFNSDRFRQMFRQFDSLNKELFKSHNLYSR